VESPLLSRLYNSGAENCIASYKFFNTLMILNQMAWVASGVSFLAISSANFLGTAWLAPSPLPPSDRHEAIETPITPAADRRTPVPVTAIAHQSMALDESNALWRCPADLRQQIPTAVPHRFPVKMQGCVVAYLADATAADRLSRQLDRQLQDPHTNWAEVMPQLTGDGLRPTEGQQVRIQQGSQILLTLEPKLAAQFGRHPHRLITDWANNIRLVAGQRPLTLTQAQKQMYAVAETANVTRGAASWYGPYFHGRMTANGEIYNQNDLTAAHRTLPLGTYVQVTNRNNGRSVIVRINDRGPYLDEDYRIIDLSHQAAQILDGEHKGVMPIDLVVLKTQPQFASMVATAPPPPLAAIAATPPQTIAFGRLKPDFSVQSSIR
jgi:rare lipoprotein A (peptidoglycan hydrolase)